MSAHISHRRLRRKIDKEDLNQRYQAVLQDPSEPNIDRFVAGVSTSLNLQGADYAATRYMISILHSAKEAHAAGKLVELLALYLSGKRDVYNIKIARYEAQMIKLNSTGDTSVLGPSNKVKPTSKVFSPSHKDEFDSLFAGKNGGR